jgi:hypothetical protein
MREGLHVREAARGATCDVHSWTGEDFPRRLIRAMAERYETGGVNVCRDCLVRARDQAKAKLAGKTE